jgi:AcrR family transcriptional regulator
MATSRAPRWQRLDHDERRRQILTCARRLFSERNYASVSTAEIASEAGVARGLLHHYFGTKRDLYLEVVRTLIRLPSNPVPLPGPGRGLEQVIDESVGRWLDMIERNPSMWLAAVAAPGLGRDPEVETILDEAREQTAQRLIAAVHRPSAGPPSDQLRALIRAYSGFAETASVEWIVRGRLSRNQLHVMLVEAFLSIVRLVLPAVEAVPA